MSKLGFPPLIWTPTTLLDYTNLVHKYTPDPADAVAHIENIFLVDRIVITPMEGTVKFEGQIREFNYHGSLFELFNTLAKQIDTLSPPYVYYNTEGMPNLIMDNQLFTPDVYTKLQTTVKVDPGSPSEVVITDSMYTDLDRLKQRWNEYGGDITPERWDYARSTSKYEEMWAYSREILDEFNAIPKKTVTGKFCIDFITGEEKECTRIIYENDDDYIKADNLMAAYMGWYNMPEYMSMPDILYKAGGSSALADFLGISLEDVLYLYAMPYYGSEWTGQGSFCYCTAETGPALEYGDVDQDARFEQLNVYYDGIIYKENAIGFDWENDNHTSITLYTGFRPYETYEDLEHNPPRVFYQAWTNLPFHPLYEQWAQAHIKTYKIQPAYVYQYDDVNFDYNNMGYNSFELPNNEPLIIPYGTVKLHGNAIRYDYMNYMVKNGNASPIDDRIQPYTSYTLTLKYTPLHSFNQPQMARSQYITIDAQNAELAKGAYISDWGNISMKASDGTSLIYNRGYGNFTYVFEPGGEVIETGSRKYGTIGSFYGVDGPEMEAADPNSIPKKVFDFYNVNIVSGTVTYEVHNEYGDVIYTGSVSNNNGGILETSFSIDFPRISLTSKSPTEFVAFFDPNLCSFLTLER